MEAVNARFAKLPEERRRLLLRRAGIVHDGAAGAQAGAAQDDRSQRDRHGWGFPTNLPPKERLVEYLQQQEQAAAEQQQAAAASGAQQPQPSPPHGGCWPGVPPPQQPQQPVRALLPQRQDGLLVAAQQQQQQAQQQQAQRRPILLELLQQSRTFQSPDCAEAMAEALGAADLHRSLRGSMLREAPAEGEVHRMRGLLRAALRTAWSNEALRRGVCLAKTGDLKGALPCYDQALQLDPGNADALVARGAAHANQRHWQHASDDLEAALQMQPAHSNARQYLDAIQSKATAGGVHLLPPEASSREAGAEDTDRNLAELQAAPGHASRDVEQRQRQRQQQQQREVRELPAQRGPDHVQARHERRASGGERSDRGERSHRKRRRASSRSRSRGRRQRGSRSRSRSRSRGREDRRRGDGSRSSSSSSSRSRSSSSDSDAAATAARLAAAQQLVQQQEAGVSLGEGGQAAEGMDVATALRLVATHYKSRRSDREKKERAKERRKRKKGGSKHGKQRHKKRKKQRH